MNKQRLIFISYLTFIVLGLAGGLLNIAWTYMQGTFDVALDSLGPLLTAGTVGALIAAFLSGSLISRFKLSRVLLGAILIAGVGMLGYSVAPVWLVLLSVAFLANLGKGTVDATLNNFASANYGPTEMNWLHACWGIGLTIAPAVVTFFVLTLEQSWRWSYFFVAGLFFVIAVLMFVTRQAWAVSTRSDETSTPVPPANIRETLRQPIVLISILLFFLYGGVEIGTGQLANTLLVEGRGMAQETASSWVSSYWGSFTIGRMLIGLLALRLGARSLIQGSMILSVFGAVLLAGNFAEVTSFAGLILIGFGLAAIFPTLTSQTPARVGRRYATHTIGFQVGFAGLGAALLPGITGVIASRTGLEVISLLILLNALIVLALYQFILWRERRLKLVIA